MQAGNDWEISGRVASAAEPPCLHAMAFHDSAKDVNFPHWLQTPAQQVKQRIDSNTLQHALLIHGPPGSGKRLLIEVLSALLLCEHSVTLSNGMPIACGQCSNCKQLKTGNHPDFALLQSKEKSRIIKVDDSRDFIDWLMLTSRNPNGYRVGVVDSADHLNRASANALLKTLEEPAKASIILLMCNWPRALPATVTSRCQLLPVVASPGDLTHDWLRSNGIEHPAALLRRAQGAPLHAIKLNELENRQRTEQLVQCFHQIVAREAGITIWVERLREQSVQDCLQAFIGFTIDIMRVIQNAEKYCVFQHEIDRWKLLSTQLKTEDWFSLYKDLQHLLASDSASFKIQPVLETVFAAIWQAGSRRSEMSPLAASC